MNNNLSQDDKKKFIYNNIQNNTQIHVEILKYFDLNDFKYTKNNNGVFINLSILDENYVDFIYNLIVYQEKIDTTSFQEKFLENIENTELNTKKIVKPKELDKKYFLSSYTKDEIKIIKYSKLKKL